MTYSRAVVERAGELRRSGLSCREIARELDGPSKSAVARWTRSGAAGGTVGRAVAKMDLPKVVGDGPVYPDIDPDDKDALIERLVLENAVLRAVNDVLKAASLDGMSNREKTLVIDRLRPAGVSVNIIFTISTNAFSPIAPTRIRRIRQRGCAAFGA